MLYIITIDIKIMIKMNIKTCLIKNVYSTI